MNLYEDILVGATPTSLKGMPGVSFEGTDNSDPWAGLLVEAPWRGQNQTIEGSPGEARTIWVRDAFEFSIGPFVIAGTDRPSFLSNLAGVRGLFAAHNVLLTRRLTAAASPFYADDSANGQYVGLVIVNTPSPIEADVVLTLRNTDGGWS